MKTKKLFMSLGTVAAVTAPVVSAVSCGTLLSSDNMEGPKVGWNDHSRTIYFNLFNQNVATQKGNMEPFVGFKGTSTSLKGPFPTLEIAQKWEQAAGYSMNKLGKVYNPNNAAKLQEGELVHVVMAAQHFVTKPADALHATEWRDKQGYYLRWAFPFHTLGYSKLDKNDVTSSKLLNFYKGYYPWNIHTNFWKAFNVLLEVKLGKDSTTPMVSTAAFKEGIPHEEAEATGKDLFLWNRAISTAATKENLEKVYETYHDKEIILSEKDVLSIYKNDLSVGSGGNIYDLPLDVQH